MQAYDLRGSSKFRLYGSFQNCLGCVAVFEAYGMGFRFQLCLGSKVRVREGFGF